MKPLDTPWALGHPPGRRPGEPTRRRRDSMRVRIGAAGAGTALALTAALLAALPQPALAHAPPGERRLSWGAFGTIALLYHDDNGLEYRRSAIQPRGAEAGELDIETDTIAGAQINAAWNRELEFVAQAITRLSLDGDWEPQIARGFVRYNWSESVQLRGGRLGWGIFPRADSRDVGYSQLTIRPPIEAFGVIPTDRFDGAKIVVTHELGRGVLNLKGYGGATRIEIANENGTTTELDDARLWGGYFEYTIGPWILRAGSGVVQDNESSPFSQLAGGLRQTGQPQAQALADDLEQWDQTLQFKVAGLAYDAGPLQVRMFLSRTAVDRTTGPNVDSGMLVGGYRLGHLTPYMSFSAIDNRDDIQPTGLPDTPEFAGLNAGASVAQGSGRYDQHSVAVGLRYDIRPGLALKAQADRVSIRDSQLQFDRRMPPRPDGHMSVFGLALEFVL